MNILCEGTELGGSSQLASSSLCEMNGTGLTADDLAGMSVKNVSADFLKDKKTEWFKLYKQRLF